MIDAHLIAADGYDRDAFRRALAPIAPDVQALRERGARLLPHFDALLEDLFCALFKLVVQVRPVEAGPTSLAMNRVVLGAALRSERFGELKEETALDAGRAAQGALTLARRAVALLKTGEVLLDEELAAAQSLAQAESEADQAGAARKQAEEAGSPLARALAQREAEAKARVAEGAEVVRRSMEGLPDRFERDLSSAAERLGEELAEREAQVDSFSRGVGSNGSTDARARLQLAERLRSSPKLEKLALLAGAFRAEARSARKQRRERANEELYRVGRGNDLGRVLPVELASLRDPVRRRDFLRRLVENDLAAYDLRGTDRHGRGPLVICIDASGSMQGPRELWSKAVALALLEIARRQRRAARAIVFSGPETPLASFELTGRGRGGPPPVDLASVVGLAECFPGGGTDFEKPLQAAAEVLRESRFRRGDVVFITDGEAPLSPGFVASFTALKKARDAAVYAIVVDTPAALHHSHGRSASEHAIAELKKVADEVTTISRLTAEAVKGLFEAL